MKSLVLEELYLLKVLWSEFWVFNQYLPKFYFFPPIKVSKLRRQVFTKKLKVCFSICTVWVCLKMLENIISRLKKKQNDQKAMSILTNIYVNIIKFM